MKVVITGANGQLGWELQRTEPSDISSYFLHSKELDICNTVAVRKTIGAINPQVIVNCAAYTAVDKAEQEKEMAFAVNSQGAANIAEVARHNGARLIQMSTDFVFNGKKSQPYLPEDIPNPICVYGASKLDGEKRVAAIHSAHTIILRTAWLYSSQGNNFVKTMLRLMRERDHLYIVSDQVGTPTWAHGLAETIWKFVEMPLNGIFHWTDSGVASWYDFAVAIQEEALQIGILENEIPITPIMTKEYHAPAKRPTFSVLDKTSTRKILGYISPHWRVCLREMLKDVKSEV